MSRGNLNQPSDDYELLSHYLLGELSEEKQEAIEKRYLDDREMYELLLVVEDDLIDAYVEGTLTESRRANLERHFLNTPDRRARVDFARAWMTFVTQESGNRRVMRNRSPLLVLPRTKSWPAPLPIAAAIILLLGGAWLVSELIRLRSRVDQAQIQTAELEQRQRDTARQLEEARRRSEELSAQLQGNGNSKTTLASGEQETVPDQKAGDHATTASIITFFLRPGLSRGSSRANKLIISEPTQQVAFQLSFNDANYKTYRVVISTVEGRMIFDRSELTARGKGGTNILTFRVPAGTLGNQDYILTLSGSNADGTSEGVAEYAFSAQHVRLTK